MNPATGANIGYLLRICLVATLGGLLFGYDTAVIAGAIGFLKEHFELTAAMTGWAASSALAGCVAGVLFAGPFSDRFGRRPALLIAGLLFLVSAVGTALPQTFTSFVIYRFLGGIGVGVASMVSPMYIAEVSPARHRGRMVSLNQLAIVTGMLVVYFVNYFIARPDDPAWNVTTGWRWMFGSEALPAALFTLLVWFIPETPRFLVETGRKNQARAFLARVEGSARAGQEIIAIEEVLRQETGSLKQLLAPGWRGVLILGIALAVLQQVTGINVFLYYAPEIFKQLGQDVDAALLQTVVVGAVNLLFTVVAIATVDRLGRKPLMLAGATGMGLCLVAMGVAAQAGALALWVLVFVLGYIACFALSVGPVTWVILSEIFPTRLRGRALGLATLCLWSANFLVSQTFPMMDEHAWLVARFNHAFPFYVYAAFCVVLVLVVWRRVPETRGRSLEDIERHWLANQPG
jgi:MFS transporter, SP family, xylose:H+ symportor